MPKLNCTFSLSIEGYAQLKKQAEKAGLSLSVYLEEMIDNRTDVHTNTHTNVHKPKQPIKKEIEEPEPNYYPPSPAAQSKPVEKLKQHPEIKAGNQVKQPKNTHWSSKKPELQGTSNDVANLMKNR